jgi:hypothetical protein
MTDDREFTKGLAIGIACVLTVWIVLYSFGVKDQYRYRENNVCYPKEKTEPKS